MRAPLVALAWIASATAGFAADATLPARTPPVLTPVGIFSSPASDAAGARAIEDAYAAYFSRAAIDKGLIVVEPDGDGYKVTWRLQPAIEAGGSPPGALEIGEFSYHLKAEANGGWSWASDAFPRIAFDSKSDKGPSKGVFEPEGFALSGHFDPTAEPFLVNKLTLSGLKGDVTETDPTGVNHIQFEEQDLSAETRAQSNAAGGVDVGTVHAVGKLSQTVTPPGGEPGGDADVKVLASGSAGGAAISGLRATEIGALWRALVAGANAGKAPDGLAELVTAALPLWNDLGADVRLQEVSVGSAAGSAGLSSFGEKIKISGLSDEGRLEFGLDVDSLKLDSPMAPAWASQLNPLSLKLAVALTDRGVGEAARLALKDPKFGQSGDLSPETQAAINQAIKAGDPKILLLPGRLTTPILDLAFEGSARVDATTPSATFKISADSLDKTLALATELGQSSPDLQSGVLALSLVKGLARTGADGRLEWDVVIEGDKVTVNGSPLPTGK